MEIETIKNIIYGIIKEILEIDDVKQYINADGTFLDIGLNSINYIKVVVSIEEKFGIEFDDELLDFEQFTSINTLCTYIKENIESNA